MVKEFEGLKIKCQAAGHILGSAYIEFDVKRESGKRRPERVNFSGYVFAPYSPFLSAPKPLYRAGYLDIIVNG